MKIKISKKNILEENCGVPAAADEVSPAPLSQLTPEEAYNLGYDEAVAEIMDMISEMMSGGVPIDMSVPADIANIDQLEEGD